MLEPIDGNQLIIGNYYYVKCKYENRHIKFLSYEIIGGVKFAVCLCVIHVIYLFTDNHYYKYISKTEFLKKVKEKYDAKCLDIVLKRLVDESFVW